MGKSNVITTALVATLLLGISGCAAPAPKVSPSPTPTPTQTQTQAEVEAEFYKIADDSCAKAQNENTVERFINDEPSRIIALAKDNAYMDYSAIYIDNKGEAQVLYELELTTCWPGYLISMMEEANKPNEGDYEHYVKKNADGTFTWTDRSYSEDGPALKDTIYVAEDGLFVKAIPEDVKNTRSFEYGPISEEDMQALRAAVDAELERLAE
jgi:hypothetical protein